MRIIGGKYKTWEGAHKRAAFENACAAGEYRRGDKAKLYAYHTVKEGDFWRVAREVRQPETGG